MKSHGQIFIFSILKTITAITLLNFCCILFAQQLLAQVMDDFEDNDLTVNPSWSGSLTAFGNVAGTLSLNAEPVSGAAYLSTPSTVSIGSWECFVHLAFNPSSSNFVRIFVQSDNHDLTSELNGYYIQVGGANDDVSLFRQSGSARTKIIDGIDGKLNADEIRVIVKATRSADGEWKLFVDGVLEGTYLDDSPSTSLFSGMHCTYTATRAKSFSFDNFIIQPVKDVQPPIVRELKIVSSNQLEVLFSEELNQSSAVDVSNYSGSDNAGKVVSVALKDDQRTVVIVFEKVFPARIECTLQIQNVMDLALNAIVPFSQKFSYYPPVIPSYKDVVITEIMSDFAPENGLPSSEFIEIFNRSEKVIDLSGWSVSDGASIGKISTHVLEPGAYAILAPASEIEAFRNFGPTVGVSSFPSLNNTGDLLVLKSASGPMIDSLFYRDNWYRHDDKREGGWTLEIIDPDNFCGEETNWIASENENGGTPGVVNSVNAENIDLRGPELLNAVIISNDSVLLTFNEKLSSGVESSSRFSFDTDHQVKSVRLLASMKALSLNVSPALEPGHVYNLSLESVYDCSGNLLAQSAMRSKIIYPQIADSLDILINEILFNPRSTGVDFIEVINTSTKYIDLRDWKFADLVNGQLENMKLISSNPLIIEPLGILAFSSDSEKLINEYAPSPPDRNWDCTLPPMSDDHGAIAILDSDGKVMDHLEYDESYHSIFLKEREGVSLERLSTTVASNSSANWKSSSSVNGFATPGFLNSCQVDRLHNDGSEIHLNPEIFIPKTGQPDFTSIEYSFDEPDFVATVKIFDFEGRTVKTIAENILLGTQGFLRWDGDRDDGSKASVGTYMLQVEIYNAYGTFKRIRKRVAIAGNF